MAVNESRSMNLDMSQGKNDGKYKWLSPDRGGEVDFTTITRRARELPWHYGLDTAGFPVKVLSEPVEPKDCPKDCPCPCG